MQKKLVPEQIVQLFKDHNGYMKTGQLKDSVEEIQLKELEAEEVIVKLRHGLYRLADIEGFDELHIPLPFIDACQSIPPGIICLTSAAFYHGLLDRPPGITEVAVPHNIRVPRSLAITVDILYFRDRFYHTGLITVQTGWGEVRFYDREKTICDLFRYRKKVGEELALGALKKYVEHPEADFGKLLEVAAKCRVKLILQPYLKALVWAL